MAIGGLATQPSSSLPAIGSRRRPVAHLSRLLGAVVAMQLLVTFWVVPAASSAGPCDPPTNPIVCENSKPGSPASEWDITGSGSSTIQGFATDISVDQGQTVSFKISTPATAYRLDIYRLGYYGGMGARQVATVLPSVTLPQSQ